MPRRDFPTVGTRVKLEYPSPHPQNWPYSGEVRAVVDDLALVVRRWFVGRQDFVYIVISRTEWETAPYKLVVPPSRRAPSEK